MINSSDITLGELFNKNSFLFHVPNYQRFYVWGEGEIQHFLDDCVFCYQEHKTGSNYRHYFGQIILRTSDTDRANRTHMEIVDGQQRLTTLTILIACLYRRLKTMEGENEQEKNEISDFTTKIFEKYLFSVPQTQGTQDRILRLSSRDDGIIDSITDINCKMVEKPPANALSSVQKIFACYEQIGEFIGNHADGKPVTEVFLWFKDFEAAVASRMQNVLLRQSEPGYCYALYQIVNDRGITLTAAELLKARTMELLYVNQNLFSDCEAAWNDILSDSGSDTEKYLLKHYQAVMYKSSSKQNLQEDFETNVFRCFGKRILTTDEQVLLSTQIKKLHQNIKYCRVLSIGDVPAELPCCTSIAGLYKNLVMRLKNDTVIPVLLNVLNSSYKINRKAKLFEEVVFSFTKFFYVAKTISSISAESIANVYFSIAKTIQERTYIFDNCVTALRAVLNNKGCQVMFSNWIQGAVYMRSSTPKAVFVLYALELFNDVEDYSLNSLRNAGDDAVTIDINEISCEHILGQGVQDDTELAERINTLGNLTIMGKQKNSKLGKKTYLEKKPIYEKSPFALTRQAGQYDQWTFVEYEIRQAELSDKAIAIFTL